MAATIISILIFVCVTLISAIILFFKKSFTYWKSHNVPYEEPDFLYGNFKGFSKTKSLVEILDRIHQIGKSKENKDSPFIGAYFFSIPCAVVTDLDLIKNILIKDFNYFTDRGIYVNEKDEPLSANLFMLDGQEWRTMRNKLSPTFTSGKMKLMFETFVNVGEEFTKTIEEMIINENIIEIKDLLQKYTTDVIGSCAFGINCNSFKDPNSEFRTKGTKIITDKRNSEIVEGFMFIFPNIAKKLGLINFTDEVNNFFMKIICETVDYREKNNIQRNDFLNILMQLKKTNDNTETEGLTIEQIAAQIFVFFLAGFETSSIAMSYCLYELALNPEIQNRLHKEIVEVLERYKGNVCYEAIKEMTYLEQVINETLRKYPSVPNILRKCIKNYKVPDTNHIIENGTILFISTYSIQNDPEIYDDPEKFDPERFSSENAKSRHPMAFLPFADGPRNCIGSRFGLMQIRVGLTFLLKNFHFENTSLNKIPIKFDIKSPFLNPADGIHLKMKKI